MEIHQKTTEHEAKDVSKYLWIWMAIILAGGYIWGGYQEPVEERKIDHINAYRGTIYNMNPVSINEHCEL